MKSRHDVTIPFYKKYKRCPFCCSRLTLSGRCRLKLGKKLICYNCNQVIQNNKFIVSYKYQNTTRQ